MQQLIIVSNRLPFRIEKKSGGYEVKQSSGGLVSALKSVKGVAGHLSWVGIADFKKSVWEDVKENIDSGEFKLEPIFPDKKDYSLYYNHFSNGVIWPLFHYFPSYAEYDEKAFEAYVAVNRRFAEKIAQMARPGDTVWVHDYHLMLLPKMIKEIRTDINIGFFLHIPFPSYEILKLIPSSWRTEIMEGLISSDVLGFHTHEYATHFKRNLAYFAGIQCNKDKAALKTHTCLIRAYPISIDYKLFNDAFFHPAVKRGRASMRQRHNGMKIIFSVDRLDYTKGVINRLEAYELLLEQHPELREKVVFVINVVPSRDQMTRYAERKKMIEENIGRINGMYGNMNWQPLIYQYRHLSFNQLLSFYTVADVALITPLRDGMNLVAKEFVASRQDKKGVLILSEFAGAASELKGAIMVNPNDIHTMKNGILEGLEMNESEQVNKMDAMQEVLKENDIHKWTSTFLKDIMQAKMTNYPSPPHVMSFDERREITEAYAAAERRLLLLDYDGTLVPYFVKPEEATPSAPLKQLLIELNSPPENEIIIISGRDSDTLEKWFGDAGISLVAEHGALYKRPQSSWISLAGNCEAWKKEVMEVFDRFISIYKGSFVENKKYSLALHYRMVERKKAEELVSELSKELIMLDQTSDFNILYGNMVVEVKSAGIDKGNFVSGVIGPDNYDFIIAIGDDATDEDMFAVLSEYKHAHTVKVGITPTKAKCNLINVNNVSAFLEQLSKYRGVRHLRPAV